MKKKYYGSFFGVIIAISGSVIGFSRAIVKSGNLVDSIQTLLVSLGLLSILFGFNIFLLYVEVSTDEIKVQYLLRKSIIPLKDIIRVEENRSRLIFFDCNDIRILSIEKLLLNNDSIKSLTQIFK